MYRSPSNLSATRHITSSILLWMRGDLPGPSGMDDWQGPHSRNITASPGLEEYRQIHLAETNPGLWPATEGVPGGCDDRAGDVGCGRRIGHSGSCGGHHAVYGHRFELPPVATPEECEQTVGRRATPCRFGC